MSSPFPPLLDASGLVSVLEEFRKSLRECNERLTSHDDLLKEAMREREKLKEQVCEQHKALPVLAMEASLNEALSNIKVLKRDMCFQRAVTRLAEYAKGRRCASVGRRFEEWRSASERAKKIELQRRVMRKIVGRFSHKELGAGFARWRCFLFESREEQLRKRGARAFFESLSGLATRKAFRHWAHVYVMGLEKDVMVVVEVATRQHARKAALAAESGDFRRAFRNQQRAILVTARLLSSHTERSCKLLADTARIERATRERERSDMIKSEYEKLAGHFEHALRQQAQSLEARQNDGFSDAAARHDRCESRIDDIEARVKGNVESHREAVRKARDAAQCALDARMKEMRSALRESESRCRRDAEIALIPFIERLDHEESALVSLSSRVGETERIDRESRRKETALRRDADDALAASDRANIVGLATEWQRDRAALADALRSARAEFAEQLLQTRRALSQSALGLPPRPTPSQLDEQVLAQFEDMAWNDRRVSNLPSGLADAAARAARALGRHAAAKANVEELSRLASDDDGSDVMCGPDEISARRDALVTGFVDELKAVSAKSRPNAGALRLEARARFLRKFALAAEAALSVYDQVIADAPTLLGRKRALPACVACNRPLPTKLKHGRSMTHEDPTTYSQVAGLLAAAWKGPQQPSRPLTPVLPIKTNQDPQLQHSSSTERATAILQASRPKPPPHGPAVVEENDDHENPPTGGRPLAHEQDDNLAAMRRTYSQNAIPSTKTRAPLTSVATADGAIQKAARGRGGGAFRANKRLPPARPKSAVVRTTGRALP